MSDERFSDLKRRRAIQTRWHQASSSSNETEPLYREAQPMADDLWMKCPACGGIVFKASFDKAHQVCPLCHKHFRLSASDRLSLLVDEGSFVEHDADLVSANPLAFQGYDEKQAALRRKTHLSDAIVTGRALIDGYDVHIGVMDGRYLMGSMGSVVGERLCRLFDRARKAKTPVITCAVSGGARMQEGIVSLWQMARTSAAVATFKDSGGLYVSVLTDPTTGGVTASFASLGDVLISEPDTLIGFAGRRVIEGTIAEQLPDGFQKAEFLQKHGFLDQIVKRDDLRATLARWLSFAASPTSWGKGSNDESWTKVSPSHHPASVCLGLVHGKTRPVVDDYVSRVFDSAIELRGDRRYADDLALYAGAARLDGVGVFVLGHRKGRTLTENTRVRFGMPMPEGYRKAERVMRLAERLKRPLIMFVDTPGAYCGVGAEERGQGEAIASCLETLTCLKTKTIVVVTGEGGSGGALAIGVGDRIAMLSNALYSVISPRGFASLLWKDPAREAEAADTMKITARDLKAFGVCDAILPEPESISPPEAWLQTMAETIQAYLKTALATIEADDDKRLAVRRERLDRIACFEQRS